MKHIRVILAFIRLLALANSKKIKQKKTFNAEGVLALYLFINELS